MSKVVYFLLCENFIFDNEKRATLVNTYDTINVTELPALANKFTLALKIKGVEETELVNGRAEFSTKLFDPQGEVIAEASGGTPPNTLPMNIVAGVDMGGQIIFEQEGVYVAKLYHCDEEVAQYTLEIKVIEGGSQS